MFKYKVAKFLIATASIGAFLISPFSDFIKANTIRRYDLRWYQDVDNSTGIQTIVVRNAGVEPKDNLVLELNFDANATRVLTDFDVAADEKGPAEKFLDTVARTSSAEPLGLLSADETTRVSQILDQHFGDRKLNYLDSVFDDILKSRMHAANGANALTYFTSNNQTTENWHTQWSNHCVGNRSNDCGPVDTVLAGWEKARNGFRNAVLQNWKERTGISMTSNSNHLSLDKTLSMTLALAPGEQRIFKFYYVGNPGNITTGFRSLKEGYTYQLSDRSSLSSWFVSVLLELNPYYYLVALFLLYLLIVLGRLFLPLQIVPVHWLFNFALQSEEEDRWKDAFDRHRYFILRQFRMLRDRESSQADMNEQEVLDLVRDWLTNRKKQGSPRFTSTESLNRSIHYYLWRLALQT
jgi:hypothetical protein